MVNTFLDSAKVLVLTPRFTGAVNLDSAKIIAIDSAMYDNGGNCGRSITITRTDNGATVTATVADEVRKTS